MHCAALVSGELRPAMADALRILYSTSHEGLAMAVPVRSVVNNL